MSDPPRDVPKLRVVQPMSYEVCAKVLSPDCKVAQLFLTQSSIVYAEFKQTRVGKADLIYVQYKEGDQFDMKFVHVVGFLHGLGLADKPLQYRFIARDKEKNLRVLTAYHNGEKWDFQDPPGYAYELVSLRTNIGDKK